MADDAPAPRVSRKDELVQVALTVLERDGFAHLSIGEVARLAGIKPPSLYKQFASKADIEVQLIGFGHGMLAEEFERPFVDGLDPTRLEYRDWVHLTIESLRRFAHEHPQLYLLMNSKPFPTDELGAELQQRAGARLIELIPDRAYASTVWAWAHGILSLELVGRLPHLGDPEAPWRELVDVVVAHMTTPPPVGE